MMTLNNAAGDFSPRRRGQRMLNKPIFAVYLQSYA